MVPAVSVKDVVVVFSDLELIKRDQEKIKVRTIMTNRNINRRFQMEWYGQRIYYHRGGGVRGVITAKFIFIATLTWGADQEHGPSWMDNHSLAIRCLFSASLYKQ